MELIRIPEPAVIGPRPALRHAVLIAGFGAPGNHAPAAAVSQLLAGHDADEIGEFDTDGLFDFTVRRPLTRVEGDRRILDWPEIRLHRVTVDDPMLGERDIVLLTGAEPHFRWRRFAEALVDFARERGIQDVVLLNAFAGATPHTRPAPLQWYPLADGGEDRFGLRSSTPRYQGPATFTMALGIMLGEAGLRVGTLNAIAPFYVGIDPSPHAVRALAGAVADEYGLHAELSGIDHQIREIQRHAVEQMKASEDFAIFVSNLEQQYDVAAAASAGGPPRSHLQQDAERRERGGSSSLLDTDAILADVEVLLGNARSRQGDEGDPGLSESGAKRSR